MTDDIRSLLATCIDDPPDDLVALYSSPRPKDQELAINILDLGRAIEYTKAVQQRTLLGKPMGLFVLDDANDSNPFCYITCGPARGCILHLHHDGDVQIEFQSLRAFLSAVEAAVQDRLHMDELPGKEPHPRVDQQRLGDRITALVQEDTDEAECELTVLARLVDTARVETVRELAQHSSFFVREAAAQLIEAHPNAQLLAIADSLAKDRHSQVARPGKQALAAIQRLVRGS